MPEAQTLMASYSNSEMEMLLSTPVDRVLAFYGKNTAHRNYMYYSPFREEAEPSMRVTVNLSNGQWVWADFGGTPSQGRKVDGGGCLEMVRRLSGVSSDRAALDVLAQINGTFIPELEPERLTQRARPTGIVLDKVSETFDRGYLVNYAERKRGIPRALLERYCKQVTYHPKSAPNRQFTVIGFPNNGGGYALRGTSPNSKKTTLCDITTFSPSGEIVTEAEFSSKRCYIFEGFMDFLSWLAWRDQMMPGADVCVLNSVSNLSKAKDWLLAHEGVRCFMDNDAAGREAYDRICEICVDRDVKDGSTVYKEYKDLNEAYVSSIQEEKTHQQSTTKSFRHGR